MKNWILTNFLGWLLGVIAILILSVILDSVGIEGFQFYVGLGIGLGVGFMQWLYLTKHGITKKWITLTALGLGAPFLIFDLINKFISLPFGQYFIIICVLLGGIILSYFQSKQLSNIGKNAKSWLNISTVGWIVATATTLSMDYFNTLSLNNWIGFTLNVFLILGGGMVLGLITNKTLKTILKS